LIGAKQSNNDGVFYGETFGQTLGVLVGEWIDGTWRITTDQGYVFWGAWGSVAWEYVETAGHVMFQQWEEDK
jgi:hypothetical protein